MGDHSDTVSYQFEIARDDWRQWADSIPRSVALDTRIRDLLEKDARGALDNDDDVEQASVDVMASRIRIRAMQAAGELRDDNLEAVEKQLADIQEIADALES